LTTHTTPLHFASRFGHCTAGGCARCTNDALLTDRPDDDGSGGVGPTTPWAEAFVTGNACAGGDDDLDYVSGLNSRFIQSRRTCSGATLPVTLKRAFSSWHDHLFKI